MQHDATVWGGPTMFDHLYRFFAAVLFSIILYYANDLPHWTEWAAVAAAIAAGIGGLFAAVHYVRKWKQDWSEKRVEQAAAAIRIHMSNTVGTVAQIAASAGVTEATAEKALLQLEQQGFARRTQQGSWQIGLRSR